MVLVPDREALTGFVMLLVPAAVLCQGTEQRFPPTSHGHQWLRHVPSAWLCAGLPRALGKRGLGSLPCQISWKWVSSDEQGELLPQAAKQEWDSTAFTGSCWV